MALSADDPAVPRCTAYNITPLLRRGIDGSGRAVTLVESPATATTPGVSNIYDDLAAYDRIFHLPVASLSVDSRLAAGARTELADDEEAMDVQIVHAIAPAANIRVVLVGANSSPDAESFGDVLSISMGSGERCKTPAAFAASHRFYEQIAQAGTTVLASSETPVWSGTPATHRRLATRSPICRYRPPTRW